VLHGWFALHVCVQNLVKWSAPTWTICACTTWMCAMHHAKTRPTPRAVKISMQDATAPDPIRCISAAAPHCHRDLRRRFGLRNLRRTSYVYVCMCLLINDSTYQSKGGAPLKQNTKCTCHMWWILVSLLTKLLCTLVPVHQAIITWLRHCIYISIDVSNPIVIYATIQIFFIDDSLRNRSLSKAFLASPVNTVAYKPP
jgi:hypothetical protein